MKLDVTEGWSPGVVLTFSFKRWVASCKGKVN